MNGTGIAVSRNEDDTAELLRKIDSRIAEDMQKHYGIGFEVFHGIELAEFGDNEEETYIRFFIVFDGEFQVLKNNLRHGEVGRIRKLLSEVGIANFPVLTFVSRLEWKRSHHKLLAGA